MRLPSPTLPLFHHFALFSDVWGLNCLLLVGQDLREKKVSGEAFFLPNFTSLEKYPRILGEVAQVGGFWPAILFDDQWKTHIKKLGLQKRIDAGEKAPETCSRCTLQVSASTLK
ncbi:hypothetical protein EON65_51235 [archaeon]|nr:MAG: hypothetical protein EON65_51235 [archaeon]